MMKGNYLKSFDTLVRDNKWLRIILMIAAITALVAVFGLLGKKERIILQPVTLTDEAWLEADQASETYRTSWAAFLGLLMGNLTPATLDFVKERLEPLLAPSIYNQTLEAFERQAQDIRDNRISLRFELRSVDYEPATGKVFAFGYRYATGVGSDKAQRSERTFEYKLNIRNYSPEITHIDTYEGKPRTQRVLRLEQMRDK